MEFTQENFDKLLKDNATLTETNTSLKTEAENKAKALKEERDAHKATKTALETTTQEKTELATKASKLEADLAVVADAKTKLEGENKWLSDFKAQKEAAEKADRDAKVGKVDELKKWFADNKKDLKETVFNALGDNLDAQIAYLEDLQQVNTPGYKAAPPKGDKAPEGQTDYDKAKATGDVKSMIANAPAVATID